jgi:propionyl-CoA carboxylase alpha chain
MIAKLICHADTREAAIEKTIRAIREYEVTGLETTLKFCKFVIEHHAFRSGNFDTHFVEKYFKPEVLNSKSEEDEELIAAVLASRLMNGNEKHITSQAQQVVESKWRENR